ncbi:putative mannan endo-1,4-beta-mannosidase [Medicago truncatula]|uniref:mannan endo-1,4-beta-mannosidase n=1 Tax=Medicago truncatula TaxID=3880 RepID=A0A396JRL0_MEDTR|nr:mannan endo-1,4-beta-mannosidase 4 isoform X1 [Medicago truncatula]RHN80929.1 putative mannan endo-1,4-beta-mannosidase [Medicago truncatula]
MGFKILLLSLLIYFISALVIFQHGNSKRVNVGGGFVQRKGTHFILNGKTHYVNGFNSYWLMIMASDPSTSSKVTSNFQQASRHGLNVGRTWACNDGGYKALQISPGKYDENVFRGLDFVISESKKYGVQLILGLVNNWNALGGKHKYVQWARERGQHVKSDDDFFTHPVVKQYYKNHVKAVLTRNNTINGVLYKDDPTIFAWELINEPRYVNDSGNSIQNWVREMATFVKSIDNKHLLEIGLEGFYAETTPQKQFNLNSVKVGTDFISNNQIPQIDFATIHVYPDEWLQGSNETAKSHFVDEWIEAHIQDSNTILKKPLVIAEFGKSSKSHGYSIAIRDNYFKKVYNAISRSAINGGSCAGGIFWQLLSQGMDTYGDGYEVVFENCPSTGEIIKQQSMKMSHIK